MAVSRERFSSISELQLPHVFIKERPFETTRMKQPVRQETQSETDQCRPFELKLSDITNTEDSCLQEKEDCHNLFYSQTEISELEKFAPHQMALERFQEKMRIFLQEEARIRVERPPEGIHVTSQELDAFLLALFRNKKLNTLDQLHLLSLFHEICLRRISIISCEELEPFRQAILETEELVQSFQERLLGDHEFSLETQRHHESLYDSLLESERKIESLFQDSVFFQGQLLIEDEIRYITNESRISCALGLQIDFLDRLKMFNDEVTFHWNLQEWILNFLSNNYEDIDDEDLKNKPLSDELLIKLGFRENSQAIRIIISRFGLLTGHVDSVELVKRFVKDELKYNPVLCQKLWRFPFLEEEHSYKLKVSDKFIDVINVGRGEGSAFNEQNIAQHVDELSHTDSVILYHGTDHCSALDIMRRGIDVNLGQSKRDFSDGAGFYLTNDYRHSETWSFSQTRKPAVLVFKVPKSFLENSSSLDLSKDEKKTDWLRIVTSNRSGRPSKKMRNQLKTYDIIQGPISKQCEDMDRPFEPREGSHQLCVKNEDCADEILEFLATVIFYD